tara:strand:- start:3071 stop:4357 length:1287 start_codon:yes stop_codon:yes gene_type:complete
MSDISIINLPDFGEFEDVEVIEICVKEGQVVNSEDPIVVLETDKAAMEIPASVKGTIKKILLNEGDKVKIGMPFLEIAVEQLSDNEMEKNENEPAEDHIKIEDTNHEHLASAVDDAADVMSNYGRGSLNTNHKNTSLHSGPATRKLAREFGINLSNVKGSGPKGRILKEDLHDYVKNILNNQNNSLNIPSSPQIDFSKWGKIKEEKLTKLKKTASENLHSSWINIPHVTQHEEIDFSKLLKLRKKLNKINKISPLAYIVKSAAETLKYFPEMNSSLSHDKTSIILKDYFNIGIAVDTENGLVVPNIKEVEKKSIIDIADEIKDLASLAKKRRLNKDQLSGATFTISSLSGVGGKFFTPIINPPEVAILGLSKTYDVVKIVNMKLSTTQQLPVSLSYDHRIINGVYAMSFINMLSEYLNDIKFLESSFE